MPKREKIAVWKVVIGSESWQWQYKVATREIDIERAHVFARKIHEERTEEKDHFKPIREIRLMSLADLEPADDE